MTMLSQRGTIAGYWSPYHRSLADGHGKHVEHEKAQLPHILPDGIITVRNVSIRIYFITNKDPNDKMQMLSINTVP